MKKFLISACLLTAATAHADTIPNIISSDYVASVQYNGGSLSYKENRYGNGPLADIAANMLQVPDSMQNSLNSFVTQQASQNGGSFVNGALTGAMNISIQPQISGITYVTFSGQTYRATTRFTGKKWGVITYSCVNTLTLSNVIITSQYGAVSGAMINDKVGVNANPSSSTDCDSNISWILPVVGNYLINQVTSRLDQGVVNGINASTAQLKDKLLFGREQNFISGLNKLVSIDKVIQLPSGGSFPIGQYLQNNLTYLIGNSQMNIRLDKPRTLLPTISGEPRNTVEKSTIFELALTSPAFSFGVKLNEEANVRWDWVCSYRDPRKQCYPDY
jgi:hypothetical protein